MSIAATADLKSMPSHPLTARLAVAAAGAALADWLFIGWDVGLSLALFLGVLGTVAVACNGIHAARHIQISMSAVFIAGLLALVEDVNILSVTLATLATALFVIIMTARETSSWQRNLFEAATVPVRGPFQLLADVTGALRHMKQRTPGWLGWLVAWIVPLGIFAIFLSLFASANPLIENLLKRINLRYLLEFFESWRLAFWIAIICAIWPLLHRRVRRRPLRQAQPDLADVERSETDYLFGEKAMSRSLVLFNLLFAVQSVLDLTYLWGGVNLPGGMSHAEYAHRGAYPLIATALLAAVFVLIAMRPKGPAENSRLIRPLVLTWIAQNILLVISSIFRLDLYIAAFSLTYLRLAAFIWMALVAIGLVLILTQIVRRKSNAWLLSANAMALALVLYGCCLLNAPWLVATYNVGHCREVSGTGPHLDMAYLVSLGSAQILPPVEARMAQFPDIVPPLLSDRFLAYRDNFRQPENWRAWGFRTWQPGAIFR
jgi:hypothetical protein